MKHPMFTEEHDMYRDSVRKFIEKEISPYAEQWEEDEWFPDEVFHKMGELGYLGAHFPLAVGGGGGGVGELVST